MRLAFSSDLYEHLSGSIVASLYMCALYISMTLRPYLFMSCLPPVVAVVSTLSRPRLRSLKLTIL